MQNVHTLTLTVFCLLPIVEHVAFVYAQLPVAVDFSADLLLMLHAN